MITFFFLSWLFYSRLSLGSTVLLQVVDNIQKNGATLILTLTVVAMQAYEAVKPKRLRRSRIVTVRFENQLWTLSWALKPWGTSHPIFCPYVLWSSPSPSASPRRWRCWLSKVEISKVRFYIFWNTRPTGRSSILSRGVHKTYRRQQQRQRQSKLIKVKNVIFWVNFRLKWFVLPVE